MSTGNHKKKSNYIVQGRPILFGTTEEFLRNFGVRTAEDLPSIQPDLVEEMKSEAEEEVQLKLNL